LVDRINDYEIRENLEAQLADYVALCRKPPLERSPLWGELRKKVESLVEAVPALSDSVRKEIDMWDVNFYPPAIGL
jgi:hypothetical protein